MNTNSPSFTPDQVELSKMQKYADVMLDSRIERISGKNWILKAKTEYHRAPTILFTSFLHMRAWLKQDQARRVKQRLSSEREYTHLLTQGC